MTRGSRTGDREDATMEAGRELDALIAERVMGFRGAEGYLPSYPRHYTDPELPEHHQATPHYSTEIAAAWLVVERFTKDGWCVGVEHAQRASSPDRHWTAWMGQYGPVHAQTAPLAICKAALAALDGVA